MKFPVFCQIIFVRSLEHLTFFLTTSSRCKWASEGFANFETLADKYHPGFFEQLCTEINSKLN